MTWLITGGTGQLGIAVSQELRERGIEYQAWGSQELDITKGSTVHDSIKHLSPKVIINCAAWTDVDRAESVEVQAFKVNSDGAENIAQAANDCGAKLIHVSTDYVFSGEGSTPWQIDDAVSPLTAYGRTKADGESRVLATSADNASIVRTAWLYSQWGKNFAKTMARLAIESESEVQVVNDQFGQPTFAVDLAKQLVNLGLTDSSAGIYHSTNNGEATWFHFAREIFKMAEANAKRVIPISSKQYPRPAKRPLFSVLAHDTRANPILQPMRDWRIALEEAMPAIISSVKAEE
jgi:dTDP-4-dehydrorhamnose reductase